MQQSGTVELSESEADLLRALVSALKGVPEVARRLGVSRAAIERGAARLPIRRGTAALLRAALVAIRQPVT